MPLIDWITYGLFVASAMMVPVIVYLALDVVRARRRYLDLLGKLHR